jgi:hypothetical protein
MLKKNRMQQVKAFPVKRDPAKTPKNAGSEIDERLFEYIQYTCPRLHYTEKR